ncbi:MAG: hypothetical protein HYY24_26840 [Verrucomicrobia bacterium]|nr:hypothetical protein [Verrucomicrobiota bacterium]
MTSTQKQLSLNRGGSKKQIPVNAGLVLVVSLLSSCVSPSSTPSGRGNLSMVDQSFVSQNGTIYNAKPANLVISDLIFISHAQTQGGRKWYRLSGGTFEARVWFTRDITDPGHPTYFAAALEKGFPHCIKVGGSEVAKIKTAWVENGIPRFGAFDFTAKAELQAIEPSSAHLASISLAPPADYETHTTQCRILEEDGKWYVQTDKVLFLLYGTSLVAYEKSYK